MNEFNGGTLNVLCNVARKILIKKITTFFFGRKYFLVPYIHGQNIKSPRIWSFQDLKKNQVFIFYFKKTFQTFTYEEACEKTLQIG